MTDFIEWVGFITVLANGACRIPAAYNNLIEDRVWAMLLKSGVELEERQDVPMREWRVRFRLAPEEVRREYWEILRDIVREADYPGEWNNWIAMLATKKPLKMHSKCSSISI